MAQTHTKSGSVQEPLALLYRNGQPATSDELFAPRFSDVCLTKQSSDQCEDVIDQAKGFDHPIRSAEQCNEYIDLHSDVDELLKRLRILVKKDREPFNKILSQISAAIEPIETKLIAISKQLTDRITQWRAVVLEGQRREAERLEREAQEKRNEAKYTENPVKRRQAAVEAKQLEKEAKAVAPTAEKGVDTEEYWVGEINSRQLASKLPEKIVSMDIDQPELNKHVKALERAGTRITPNILPGLTITRKTRVRFHR